MTPYQYVDTYHMLRVVDSRLGLDVTAQLSKYRAGWFPEDIAEADTVLGILAARYFKKKSAYGLPSEFSIPDEAKTDPGEVFYPAGIRRAFASRGSPDECIDALRLAVLAGRCKPAGAKAYAEKWFGQDCNAFAGNWLGLSPMTAIFAYAHGYADKTIKDSKNLQAVQSYLPFPPRENPSDIAQGDLILTFGSLDHRGFRYRHVGVVQRFQLKSLDDTEGEAQVGLADVDIAEWGQAGQSHHKNSRLDRTLIVDAAKWKPKKNAGAWSDVLGALKKEKPFKDKTVVGFVGTDPNGKNALRIFVDASSTNAIPSRGWHCGSVYGV